MDLANELAKDILLPNKLAIMKLSWASSPESHLRLLPALWPLYSGLRNAEIFSPLVMPASPQHFTSSGPQMQPLPSHNQGKPVCWFSTQTSNYCSHMYEVFINVALKFRVCMVKNNEFFVGHLLRMAGPESGAVTQLAEELPSVHASWAQFLAQYKPDKVVPIHDPYIEKEETGSFYT